MSYGPLVWTLNFFKDLKYDPLSCSCYHGVTMSLFEFGPTLGDHRMCFGGEA